MSGLGVMWLSYGAVFQELSQRRGGCSETHTLVRAIFWIWSPV